MGGELGGQRKSHLARADDRDGPGRALAHRPMAGRVVAGACVQAFGGSSIEPPLSERAGRWPADDGHVRDDPRSMRLTGRTVEAASSSAVAIAHGPRPVLAVDVRRATRADGPHERVELGLERLVGSHLDVDDVARERRGVAGDQPAAREVGAGEGQALGEVVQLEHALLPDDAQLAALGGRQPVDVEHARRARREVQQPEQQVLVRSVLPLGQLRVDARRPLARDPRQHVRVVRRQVDRDADVADPGRERPGAPADDRVQGREPALARAARRAGARPGCSARRGRPGPERRAARPARTISSASAMRRRKRLLDEHRQAAFDGGVSERTVERCRCGDDDGIHVRLADHRKRVGPRRSRRTGRPRPPTASASGSATAPRRRHGGVRDDAHVVAAHRAEPDEPDAHRRGHRRTGVAVSRTAPTIVASSSSVSSGCTGIARTSSARRSVTGRRRSAAPGR